MTRVDLLDGQGKPVTLRLKSAELAAYIAKHKHGTIIKEQ